MNLVKIMVWNYIVLSSCSVDNQQAININISEIPTIFRSTYNQLFMTYHLGRRILGD